ncbi:histidine phosphatase family protein [Methylomonas sp. LW13]|uniref:Histidine phosphatase family protein n=1 Tax=Methylomonas defluvii TaxID=3045149 RepID=A0ABU4UE69_9GAMM|nr:MULTISPECIES: histidine phosphatase family protein [unclassified Methylomonas]MDX8127775.1 histidine phosphatase family protein [Methylomonas sp. OY6]QBC27953.1 histidine phosphatase family protein [Methylomonas sp. LW13]
MYSSNQPRRIYLARHGQSELNLQQRISGQADAKLSAKGMQQAEALADVLRQETLSTIYSSSLTRAIQTAAPTAAMQGLPIRTLDGLREIGLGILEGRHVDERDPEASRLWAAREQDKYGFSVPGCEAYADFSARVLSTLQAMLAGGGEAMLIVAHRNTNEIILNQLLGADFAGVAEINVKNKYLYAIDLRSNAEVMTIRLGGEQHGRRYAGLRT